MIVQPTPLDRRRFGGRASFPFPTSSLLRDPGLSMAVAVRGTPNSATTTDVKNNVAKPAGMAYGDVVIFRVGFDTGAGTTNITSVSAGFTLLQSTLYLDASWQQSIYFKVVKVPTSEPANYTANFNLSTFSDVDVTAVSGADPTVPIANSTANTDNTNSADGLSCTLPRAGCLLLVYTVLNSGTRTSGPAGTSNILTYDSNVYLDSQSYSLATPAGTGTKSSALPGAVNWIVQMVTIQARYTPTMMDVF